MSTKKTTEDAEHHEAIPDDDMRGIYQPESRFASYIPGGYSRQRLLPFHGLPMLSSILALAGTAIFFFGIDASLMSQIVTNKAWLEIMGAASGSAQDSARVGGIVSIWFLGFAIGAVLVGSYADRIGRLKTIEIGCVWALLGGALEASARNITWMMISRVVSGIGCGHLNTVVPIWTSELADPKMRGAFVAVEFTLAISGSTLVYWMEYGCSVTQSADFSWRFPMGFQCIFLLMILVAVPFFPESPRYLAKRGDMDEARDILTRSRLDPDPKKIDLEMEGIKEALRLEATSTAHSFYSMIFTKDDLHTRRRIMLGCGVQVMQKLTGIDFIAAYAPSTFSLSGYSSNKATLLAGGNFFGYIISLASAIWLADRLGRRTMMLTGSFCMGVVLIIGGILSHFITKFNATDPTKSYHLGAGVATILYLYTFIYGSTWLTTCWVYPTEVFSLSTRAKGTALATVAFSIAGGVINEIIPYLITAVGFWTFIIFALLNFGMLVPIYLFYIETANRELEEMDLLFSSGSVLARRAEKEFAAMKERRRSLPHDVAVDAAHED